MPTKSKERPQPVRSVRRNMALPQASITSIKTIREQTAAPSDTEVVRRALKFYEMVLTNQKAGARIVLKDDQGNDVPVIIL